jgi:hypothetical protein
MNGQKAISTWARSKGMSAIRLEGTTAKGSTGDHSNGAISSDPASTRWKGYRSIREYFGPAMWTSELGKRVEAKAPNEHWEGQARMLFT